MREHRSVLNNCGNSCGTAEHGWASIILSIWLVGGVTILSIGGVGVYIGKMYVEIKHRPLYNIKEFLD